MNEEYIWIIFVAEKRSTFANFYPIGVFTEHEQAVVEINQLPKVKNYQLLKLPVNRMFPYYHKKSGELVGMHAIHHQHFHFSEDAE